MVIDIEQAKPGMVLLEDVLLPNGTILVNSGHSLSDDLITTIKHNHITTIQVMREEQHPAGNEPDPSVSSKPETKQVGAQPEELEPSVPSLQVIPADDSMSAQLRVQPAPSGTNDLTDKDIQAALNEAGVLHGISDSAIRDLLNKWSKLKKFYEISGIATGTRPQPGREGKLAFTVQHITGDKDIDIARSSSHYWELADLGLSADRVDSGTVVARKQGGTPPVPGIDIYGQSVDTNGIVRAELKLDSSVELDADETAVLAKVSGVAYQSSTGLVGILPVSFDGDVELELAEGNMEARLVFHAAGEGGTLPGRKKLESLLQERGVTFGIDNESMEKTLNFLAKGHCPSEPVVIARGQQPEDGTDGKAEILISTETSLKPKANPDGSVDYKNVDIVNSVTEGQELARLIPPTKGTPGKDVRGNELPCKDGSPATLPAGTNTEPSPENPDALVATTGGNARWTGSVVEVSEGYVIDGDVDFSTGNVKYGKSVSVAGDIKTGFSVECGGDLQVSGTIEDAKLDIGGSVLCKAGFVGQGKGGIVAKGNVNIGFLKNQTIRSRGSVNVAREALNGKIFARKSISVLGNPLSVAGGTLLARDCIHMYTVGNASGIRTNLEIGLDFTLTEELTKTENQLSEASANFKKILETYKKYEQLAKRRKQLPEKDRVLFAKLKNTLVKYHAQIKTLQERTEVIKAKMYDFDNAYIKVDHAALPGTLIKIGERHMLVKEEIIGPKTIRLIDFEIRVL